MEDRYRIGEKIGQGSFGHVFVAVQRSTNEKRAIKRIKGSLTWDAIVPLRELQCFCRVPPHANIVKLFEVHRTANSNLYFVFEYMPDGSLYDLLEKRAKQGLGPLDRTEIQSLVSQVLAGLAHLHDHHHMHRDMKPENILLSGNTAKVADFSLARGCRTEQDDPMTTYVSTRWYRAPEILLQANVYDVGVDIFGFGCIVAELCTGQPLFPGRHDLDQLSRIVNCLGSPAQHAWSDGIVLLRNMGFTSNEYEAVMPPTTDPLRDFLVNNKARNVDDDLVDFIWRLLALDPACRLSARQALQHSYLHPATHSSATKAAIRRQQILQSPDSSWASSATSTPAVTSGRSKVVSVSPKPDNRSMTTTSTVGSNSSMMVIRQDRERV